MSKAPRKPTTYGFKPAGGMIRDKLREATGRRGFAETRLLTDWAEIAGARTAAVCRPVKVTFDRRGLGTAALQLLTTGAQAPMLEMQKEQIRKRVNACYGYNAIARIQIVQSAPTGFAEGQVQFAPAPKRRAAPEAPTPEMTRRARAMAEGVEDDTLRDVIEKLAEARLQKVSRDTTKRHET